MHHNSIERASEQLSQPTIWIVGASSGIGLALVESYLNQGFRVVLSARRVEHLQRVRQRLREAFPYADLHSLPLDVLDNNSIIDAQHHIQFLFGYIDKVIINAGICEYVNAIEIDVDVTRRVMETNFFGALNIVNASLPLLRNALEKSTYTPQLVFVSSSVAYQALPRAGAYGASKAALSYFAESLKLDLGHEGIDVRIVSPGFVKTPLTDQNDFAMPARISAKDAAERIISGLNGHSFDVNFPKRFTWSLKLISAMPTKVKHWLLGKISRHEADMKVLNQQSASKGQLGG